MVMCCIVCKARADAVDSRSFHRFPNNASQRAAWILSLGIKKEPSKLFASHVCSDHFESGDILLSEKLGKKYLREGAIPNVNSHSECSGNDPKEEANIPEATLATDYLKNDGVDEVYSVPEVEIAHVESSELSGMYKAKRRCLDLRAWSISTSQISSESTITASETVCQSDEEEEQIEQTTSAEVLQALSLVSMDSNGKAKSIKKRKRPLRFVGDFSSSDMDDPHKARICLTIAKKTLLRQANQIKNIKRSQRRLRNRVNSLKSLLKFLNKKYSLTESAQSVIQASLSGSAADIMMRVLRGPSRQKYSPELRSFALTLSFYSARAYSYVREKFYKSLPHPSTITKWFRSVDGSPGFTEEALSALKAKVSEASINGRKVLCNLVMDEMAIMKRVEWNGKRFTGYVDFGTEVHGDVIPEAKEALVFMLVAVNGHWKVPVGYFLIDGLCGNEKANLVLKLLEFLNETCVIVTSFTFDGTTANLSMASALGANFDNPDRLKTNFCHPITNEPIFIYLDPCHMLKLWRNCLATLGTLYDGEGEKICWNFFQSLVDLQNQEGLQAATRLKNRHMMWERERMKVSLAAQTFSTSVADALIFCERDLKLDSFKMAGATAEFARVANNLFDIFNSRNKFWKAPLRRGLSPENASTIFSYLEKCRIYILSLRYQDIPIVQSKRKTGFVGFLICIKSLQDFYSKYIVESTILKYVLTYKFSQDHLEIFFSAVRNKGGNNNNPTARQFEYIYKRLLIHSEIQGSEKANAIALDSTSILWVGSSSVTKTNCGSDLLNSKEYLDYCQEIKDLDFISSNAWHLTPFIEDVVSYIAGFVVRCLKKCVTCSECLTLLEDDYSPSLLLLQKKRGALIFVSKFVVTICKTAEKTLKVFIVRNNIFTSETPKELLVASSFRTLPETIFESLRSQTDDHGIPLIKMILNKYLDVRLHHETSKLKDSINGRVRSILTKTILFKNQ